MLLKLIDDMNRALDSNLFFAALSIALMLHDICGKAAYPEEKVGQRYKKWFDENIAKYEKSPICDEMDVQTPYLSGEVVYQLRNAYLHQGNPNIEKDRINEPQNKIDRFQLIIERKKEFNTYCDTSLIFNDKRIYRVNIRRLCLIIGRTATGYYLTNREKFNFFNYSILDRDKELAKFQGIVY